ncbi:MAG: hypothetical protein SCH98_15495 [Deferrisomatales bacterium]|nr:hypothetical protein [Deferrisomatales bacterium]
MRHGTALCELADRRHLPLLYALTGVGVAAGVYFRFKGLGTSPFAIDEYYLATSVKKILAHGLPRFECGGFYTRGILLQYLAAPLFLSGMSHELAFRLITVLSNLAAMPAVFLLGRHLAGAVAGCIALLLFSLALWEVEFARFARMYAPFGTLFLWHLYFLYRRVILGDTRASKWMYLLALVSVVVSEFAIFLVLLSFLPLFLRGSRPAVKEGAVPAVLLLLTYRYQSTNFRRLGAGDYLPPDLVPSTGSSGIALPVHLPPLLLPQLGGSLPWLLAFLVPLLLALVAAGLWLRWSLGAEETARRLPLAALPIALLGMALLNAYGLLFFSVLLLVLLSGLARRDTLESLPRLPALATGVSLLACLLFWGAFAAATDASSAVLGNATGVRWKDAVLALFQYPDVYKEVVLQWMRAMPLQTVLMAIVVAGGAWAARRGETSADRGYLLFAAAVVGLCVLVAVLRAPYSTSRYTYFLYPVVLLLVAVSMTRLGNRLSRKAWVGAAAAVGLTAGFMLVSEDFEARHLTQIDSERVTYRMGYSRGKTDQYYTRRDFRGPAQYVNANRRAGDAVVVTDYGVPYYLERLDYLYMGGRRYFGIAGCAGTKDIWEGASLLRTKDELFQVLQGAGGTVWLIAKSDRSRNQSEGERAASAHLGTYRVYRSVDEHLDVYRLSPEGSSPPLGFLREQIEGSDTNDPTPR